MNYCSSATPDVFNPSTDPLSFTVLVKCQFLPKRLGETNARSKEAGFTQPLEEEFAPLSTASLKLMACFLENVGAKTTCLDPATDCPAYSDTNYSDTL